MVLGRNRTWTTLLGGKHTPDCTIPASHIISYVYLEIYLFFSSSFSLVVHNYLLHSSLGIAACGVLALFAPFRNTWLALVYQGHATIEKQQQKTMIILCLKLKYATFWYVTIAPSVFQKIPIPPPPPPSQGVFLGLYPTPRVMYQLS